MLFIQHNLLAQNANRQLNVSTNKNAKTTEKLSSGYKINRAADDAAGLSISEKMRRQVRGLHQSVDNISEGVGYVQTAEGALNEVQDMLQRINELAVKAANGTNTNEDRMAIDREIQQLKNEMNRIFSETTFNERKIWDYGPGEQLEYMAEPAVTFKVGSSSVLPGTTKSVTNANCGVLALATGSNAGYTTHANDSGIWVTWTGYDGHDYKTDTVKWEDLEINGNVYSFEMSDYFGKKEAGNDLYILNEGGEYEPVFKKTVSFNVSEEAWAKKDTNKDYKNAIINSINGAKMTSTVGVGMTTDKDHCNNISSGSSPVYVSNPRLEYGAAYISHVKGADDGYTFDGKNDSFLVPSSMSGNLNVPANANDKYVFTFNMPGIGKVTATPTSGSYTSTDRDMGSIGYWWNWVAGREEDGTWNPQKYQGAIPYSCNGSLGAIQNALQAPHGLLLDKNGGNTDTGGRISISFSLTAEDEFTYGKDISTKAVGSFSMYIDVNQSNGTLNLTYDQMMAAIDTVLNSSTVLDFSNEESDSGSIGELSGTLNNIYIPIYPDDYVPYDDTQNFYVQAGTESGQHISIKYEYLSIEKLGMADTNALTEESAGKAINEVKRALQIVSEQRSDFGAYQNRLDHAHNINSNVEENTQSAESLIRDTDIADTMVEYSINNILMQAGTSMLTQANQSSQSILQLLQ